MSAPPPLRTRGLALLIGLGLAGPAAWWAYSSRADTGARSPLVLLTPHTELEVLMLEGSRPGALEDKPWIERFADSPLRRFAVDEPTANRIFGGKLKARNTVYDPFQYYARRPGLKRRVEWKEHDQGFWHLTTNGLGLRRDTELAEHADLRVLVAGDSHTEGYCDYAETYCALLEDRLGAARPADTVEVLNAGVTGHSFYHYLGSVERYARLAPQVVLVMVYGGNDFNEMLTLHHIFNGSVRPPGPESLPGMMKAAADIDPASLGQCFWTLKYFQMNPEEVAFALEGSVNVMREIRLVSDALDARLLVAYLPPATDHAWVRDREIFEGIARVLELGPEDLDRTRVMAGAFLERVREFATVVDLSELMAAGGDAYYWRTDQHINVEGNRVVAERLAEVLTGLLD